MYFGLLYNSTNVVHKRFTRPGGWCEWQECEYNLYSEDGTFIENNAVDRWVKGLIEAATEMGRVASPGLITEKYAREAGFVNITHEVHKIPMTPWAKETKYVGSPLQYGTRNGR